MFLAILNDEKKKLFLNLSIYAAKADNLLAEEEKAIINAHCTEMGLNNNNYEPNLSLNESLEKLSKICSSNELNMIVLEIMAVILADNEYSDSEKDFIKEIEKHFNIDKIRMEKACTILKDLKDIYKKMNDFILDI